MALSANTPVLASDYSPSAGSLKGRITIEAARRSLPDPAPPAVLANARVFAVAEFNVYRSALITLNSIFTIPLPTLPPAKAAEDRIVAADVALLSVTLSALEAVVTTPPIFLSASPITHLTIWTGGIGDTGTCYPNGCGVGAPCFPRNFVPALTVQTVDYPGAFPLIKIGSQTVSFSASSLLDFGFHLWYEINTSGVWNYAALLGAHPWDAQGWVATAGTFGLTVGSVSIVRFATTAGNCWQDNVQSGVVNLSFPN